MAHAEAMSDPGRAGRVTHRLAGWWGSSRLRAAPRSVLFADVIG